jgi:hypothetical protein
MSMNNPWLSRPQSVNPTFPGPQLPPPPGPNPPSGDPVVDPPAPGGRGRGRTVAAVVGVAALLAAGAFAVVKVVGNDSAGGASSPDEVGLQLVESLDGADVLGVIDLLLPGERETMREPMIEMFDNLRRIGVLADEASLSGIGGLELEFTDIQVVAEPTNVDDITNVRVSGSVTASIDGAKVPIGDLIIDDILDGERPDMSMDATTEEFDDLQFTAVEQDGRWYLSLFHSIAESARGDQPVPAEGMAVAGADSPEGAVDALLTAVQDLKLDAALGLLDPTELEALHRYAPLFLADAQQALDDIPLTWAVTNRSYRVEGSGSRRSVIVESLDFDASIDGVDLSARVADDCVTFEIDGESTEACSGEATDAAQVDELIDELGIGDPEAAKRFFDSIQDAVADVSSDTGVAVHEVDGEWYVSPMRSGFDALNTVLAGLERSELVEIIDSFEGFVGSVDDSIALPGLDDEGLGDGDLGEGGDDLDPDFAALSECTMESDPAAAIGCIQAGIADGSIDPSYVSVPVRFPECGVAELYVLGEVYFMDDAAFVEAVTAASPCFLGLIDAGAVDSFEVPYEVLAPECLLGKNWYASSDPEANEAFYECAEAVRLSL